MSTNAYGCHYYGILYSDGAQIIMFRNLKGSRVSGLLDHESYSNYIPGMATVSEDKMKEILQSNYNALEQFRGLKFSISDKNYIDIYLYGLKREQELLKAKELSEGLSRLSNDCSIQ